MIALALLASLGLSAGIGGAIAGERLPLLAGLAVFAVAVLAAVLLDLLSDPPKPQVEVHPDPFGEIDYLIFEFPPLVHEEERAA